MTQDFRSHAGGRIDRAAPLDFSFDGKRYRGFAGDTLASALLANGVHLMGRSFKYHRPRGVLSAGADEPNALVAVGVRRGRVTPNLRATQVELYQNLHAVSQNNWPSLRNDVGAISGAASALLPAGFYYKTFMRPAFAWRWLYEPAIRRAAGLGVAPSARDPDRYANLYAHCDIAIIGAGPAGIAAALGASAGDQRVILCDEQSEMGGSLLSERDATIDGASAAGWLAASLATLRARPNVTLLPRTQAFGYYAQNFLGLVERVTDHRAEPDARLPRERLWQVRAGRVVLAAGAHERPLAFPDNDRPGIMLADAARTFVNRYGVLPGVRAVVVTAHDFAYRAALDMAVAGVAVAAIVDLRAEANGPLPAAARARGLRVIPGAVVLGATGVLRVAGIVIASAAGAREAIACDVIAMSGGWTPSVHLFSQSRGTLAFDAASGAFLPAVSAQNERSIGACAGVFGLEAALIDGASAGDAAAPRPSVSGDLPAASGALVDGAATDAKAFVDFQNDVTARDLRLAAREGMRSIEHIKRYTTTGMATDQGKSSNINALAIAADALGKTIPEVGLTTFRAPYTPATFATFATMTRGPLYDPVRQTPLHSWARDNGAVFEEAGLWMRASRFPRAGESVAETIARECNGTRNAAGMMDASTLGKLEVVGPDAAEFLNRTYINSFDKLAVGRCRYGIMLSEQGMVMDDGVIARLAPGRFHVTTTSVGAAHVVAQWDDYAQTEWPELKVWYTSITEQWATIAINGPRARDMLLPLVEGVDISAAAMPHMAVREGRICGVPTRLFRVSFTGELGFEVNVPADYGRSVWEAIWAQGQAHGCVAYGLDTLLILRAEKGYIVVGQETDSTVTPDDLGYRAMIAKKKPDFVGKRSLAMADLSRPGRKQLVGLLPSDTALKLDEGAQIVETPTPATGSHAIGHVTSAYFSPTLGRGFALALIENGRARMGDMVHATTMTGTAPARIVETVFHDKEGKRLDG